MAENAHFLSPSYLKITRTSSELWSHHPRPRLSRRGYGSEMYNPLVSKGHWKPSSGHGHDRLISDLAQFAILGVSIPVRWKSPVWPGLSGGLPAVLYSVPLPKR